MDYRIICMYSRKKFLLTCRRKASFNGGSKMLHVFEHTELFNSYVKLSLVFLTTLIIDQLFIEVKHRILLDVQLIDRINWQ